MIKNGTTMVWEEEWKSNIPLTDIEKKWYLAYPPEGYGTRVLKVADNGKIMTVKIYAYSAD